MELRLQINGDGIAHKLISPDGEEVSGIAEIILPVLDDNDVPLVTVKFYLTSGILTLI